MKTAMKNQDTKTANEAPQLTPEGFISLAVLLAMLDGAQGAYPGDYVRIEITPRSNAARLRGDTSRTRVSLSVTRTKTFDHGDTTIAEDYTVDCLYDPEERTLCVSGHGDFTSWGTAFLEGASDTMRDIARKAGLDPML